MTATITSTTNATVKAAKKLLRRHGRDRSDRFLVEGPAVLEGLHATERLFATADALSWIETPAAAHAVDVVVVDEAIIRELAETVTSRGVVAVARMPRPSLDAAMASLSTMRVLVADGVSDPGNAGTLIRSADAAGFDAVLFTTGSVDPRSPKTVRATAGSLFHLPVVDRVEPADVITACATAGLRLVGASAQAPTRHVDVDLARRCALVVGNEARGLTPVLADALDDVVSIPMQAAPRDGYRGVPESLNLAVSASVLMYESTRQQRLRPASAGCEDAP